MPSRRDILIAPAFALFGWPHSRASIAKIRFRVEKNGNAPWRFLHIHGDETTAREVLSAIIKKQKGTAFLVESTTREVSIGSLRIDPNRMFSREGAKASLLRLNEGASDTSIETALAALDRDRDRLLKRILPPPGGVLIALHNNLRGYSMDDELSISEKSSKQRNYTSHEFLLAASPHDFELILRTNFNCVLQRNPPPPDDGSLSRLCANRKIRYINIEAAIGNAAAQQDMLQWVLAHLPSTAEFE